jgi:hypothetical protein
MSLNENEILIPTLNLTVNFFVRNLLHSLLSDVLEYSPYEPAIYVSLFK